MNVGKGREGEIEVRIEVGFPRHGMGNHSSRSGS